MYSPNILTFLEKILFILFLDSGEGKEKERERNIKGSSGQDGGVGRNPLLPCTTKRRITTNLKSISNQKRQKIKLHGTLTTKELKKKSIRTTRPVRRGLLRPTQKNREDAADRGGGAG